MKYHRGLGAVVGTVFLVAVVISALSYVSYSLNVMGNLSESLIVEESRQKDKQSESFEISSIDVTGSDKLAGVIKNTGEIPIKITTLWIDEQGIDDVVQKFNLDAEIAPGNTVDLSSLVDFTMSSTKGYNMKVVSSRGQVNSFYVNSLANENVYMSLTATPTIIPSTFSSTLLFTVVNNMSNGNHLYNLTPIMNDSKQSLMLDSTGLLFDKLDGPTPTYYESLGPGEVAVFTYEYELTSDTDGDVQLFNVTLANANPGNEALSRIAVKTVPLATDAGSALTSLGLSETSPVQADVLYLHDLNSLTPNGEYPMDGSSPNSAGITKSPNGNTLEFISSGMTEQTTVPQGSFTVALNYFSNSVPLNLPEPSYAFMMDSKDCGENDALCDMINLFDDDTGLKEQDNKPQFSGDFDLGGGPDGSDYFEFGGVNEWLKDDWNVDGNDEKAYTEPGDFPDTDAIWVRIEDHSLTHQSLVRFGNSIAGDDDILEIATVNGGYIQYRVATGNGGSNSVTCTSDSDNLDDDQWHHVVGVRDSAWGCKLYIDGKLQADTESASYGDSGYIDVDWISVGAEGESSGEGQGDDFDGDIANWIHWNNHALSAAQVEDLYYTNYGNNGTRLHMKVEVVDDLGTTLLETIIPETKIELPFHDPSFHQDNSDPNPWLGLYITNSTDLKYQQGNMTAISTSDYSIGIGERLKLTLDWKGEDEQNLPINIMWDDSGGWSLPDGPSYIQTPEPTPNWPTFLTFSYDDMINYLVYNEGPGGIWFVFSGTRLVLTSLDGLESFAAVPKYVNATTQPNPADTYAAIKPDQDSIYIPAENFAEIDFYQIQSPPSRNDNPPAVNEVPTGDYDAALYLQGYDESGKTFKKTIDLGLVHILGNP